MKNTQSPVPKQKYVSVMQVKSMMNELIDRWDRCAVLDKFPDYYMEDVEDALSKLKTIEK